MTKTFHILARTPRGQRRVKKTLCGQPLTGHDIMFGWQAFAVGNYVPCVECCHIRAQLNRDSRKAKS